MIIDPDFLDHWKTRMLVGNLADEAAPLYVIRLWAHCQNRRQSYFESLTTEALKALCRFPGPANKLEASLSASGFIRRDGEVLVVCNWDEYNSSLIAAWENGRKGGRPRKPNGNPRVNPAETHGVTDKIRVDKSREDNKKSNTKSKPKSYSEAFDRWWQLYPRRVGKDAAWLAYQKAVDRIVANEDVEQPVAESLLYDWTSDRAEAISAFEVQYQPHPATWLNAGRYQDEIVTASKVADLTDMENYRP